MDTPFAQKVVNLHPSLFVGVNCLDLRPQDVICRLPEGVEGVWTNDQSTLDGVADVAIAIRQARETTGWDGILFATPVTTAESSEPGTQIGPAVAAAHIDVPTLVGYEFRQQPVEVVQKLRQAFSGHPLGVAAAISAESVDALLPYTNCVMTTARTDNGLELTDSHEARRLATKIHAS